jgi:hypothetical protein
LALELLEVLNRHLVPRSARGDAVVGLASERWRRTTPEERSKALRDVALARWNRREAKTRRSM